MASYKQPVIVPRPPRFPAPVIFPSAIWKTPANVYRPPIDKPFFQQTTISKPYEFVNDVPALSAPAIPNTIKQVGEKGPIHTIPAPNLSPADRPAFIKEEIPHKAAYNFKEQEISVNSIQNFPLANIPQALPLIQQLPQQHVAAHQYQVNEYQEQQLPNERPAQFAGPQTYYAPDPDPKLNLNNFNADLAGLASNTNLFPQGGATLGTPQPAILAAQHNIVSPPGLLSYQELQQILNSIPQQHLVDSYGTPLVQQPQLQQHFMQQANLPVQQTLFQPEVLNQIQDVPESIKNNFKPQFHTFNYDEQSRQNAVPSEFAQSRVTGDYQIEQETSENNPTISVQSPNEALAQTQYVQQYFANNDDNVNENVVEDETDKEATRILSQLASNGDVSPNMFYTSLPNRETAETLASLQAAGNVNSNLMKNIPQNDQPSGMRIYVPDEEDSEEMETSGETEEVKEPKQGIRVYETTFSKQTPENHKSKDSVEYDDLVQSEESRTGKEEYNTKSFAFGSRIKAKNET